MSTEKRGTRSQLTLPDFFNHLQLQRSPLKEARSAIRNTTPMDYASTKDDGEDHVDNNTLLSPKKKRPSSPSFSDAGLQSGDREPKRSKKERDSENEVFCDAARGELATPRWRLESFMRSALKKPASFSPSFSNGASPSRARSVPPMSSGSSTPVPHLDLRTIPPSPWRSPAKERPRLRVMSVPPPSPPPEYTRTPTQHRRAAKAQLVLDDVFSPAAVAPGGPEYLGAGKTPGMLARTPAQRPNLNPAFMSPLSPLTPLPLTPFHGPSTVSPRPSAIPLPRASESAINDATDPAASSTLPYANSTSNRISSSSTLSRIPRPSFSSSDANSKRDVPSTTVTTTIDDDINNKSQPIASSSSSHTATISTSSLSSAPAESETRVIQVSSTAATTNETAPTSQISPLPNPAMLAKTPSSGVTRTRTKQSKRLNPVALGGRMTRSVTLRMRERQKKEDSSNAPAVLKPRISTTYPMASSSSSVLPATSTPAKSRTSTPSKAGLKSETPSHQRWPSVAPTPTSSSFVTPSTSSSTTNQARQKSMISSGALQRLAAPPTSNEKAVFRSVSLEPGTRPASLSNLSMALEKLSLPPPARPNTSMGFNRVVGGGGGDIFEKGTRAASVVRDVQGSVGDGGRSVGGANKPVMLKKTTTITSFFSPAGSSSSSSSSTVASSARSSFSKASTGGTSPLKRPSSIFIPPSVKSKEPLNGWRNGRPAVGGINSRVGNTAAGKIFGKSGGAVVGTKVFNRVSKKSTLPSVEGSPVKGGPLPEGSKVSIDAGDACAKARLPTTDLKEKTGDDVINLSDIVTSVAGSGEPSGSGDAQVKDKGKERHLGAWSQNASRRASLASEALSQSLSSLPPQTPPKSRKGSMGPPPLPRYSGLRSASSSYPSSSSSGLGKAKATTPGMIDPDGESHVSGGGGEANGSDKEASKGALKVLKECVIFVDVKTDGGDDAGSLFVDMLKGLGARILTRVGQTCTHIVYKNGLTSTLTRYRQLDDPKPCVVGIAWVVECAEQRYKVDETKFQIDLQGLNVAGIVKRRRSMLPKQVPVVPRESPASVRSLPGESRSFDSSTDIDRSYSNDESDDLPPLEKARRRRSILLQG